MTNDIADIRKTTIDIICRELKLDSHQITEDTNLRELPDIDSIKILRIILSIEEQYDIELEDEVVFGVETVTDIALAVADRLAKT